MRRRAYRKDENEGEIADALVRIGCSIVRLSSFGVEGAGDLLVSHARLGGMNLLLECKPPNGALTPAEIDFTSHWKGHHAVVRSVDEAMAEVVRHFDGARAA